MYLFRLSQIVRIGGAAALLLGLLMPTPQAETFISYNGRFHFTYPDTWTQLDYTTSEFYLTRGNPDVKVDYEAIFCEKQTLVLFQDQYLILTVDTVGNLAPSQIDSVLAGLKSEFKRPVKEVEAAAFLSSSCRDSIICDRAGGRISVESEVTGDSAGTKINLLVMKAYEHGIANFYFYCPSAKYLPNLPVYREMVMSLSTETLQPSAPAGPIKVADIETEPEESRNYPLLFGLPAVVIIVIIAVRARKKRQQPTSSENQKG